MNIFNLENLFFFTSRISRHAHPSLVLTYVAQQLRSQLASVIFEWFDFSFLFNPQWPFRCWRAGPACWRTRRFKRVCCIVRRPGAARSSPSRGRTRTGLTPEREVLSLKENTRCLYCHQALLKTVGKLSRGSGLHVINISITVYFSLFSHTIHSSVSLSLCNERMKYSESFLQ